jgi:KDEL-tailed cysteine endopeptidase
MGFASQYCFCFVVIVTLGALASPLAAARSLQDASMRERHEEWMASYGRVYKDTNEKQKRYKIFEENVALIESSNGDPNKLTS